MSSLWLRSTSPHAKRRSPPKTTVFAGFSNRGELFDNDLLTALAVQSEIAGATTIYTWPEAEPLAWPLTGATPGLGSRR
jgi:hypothetical protein